MLIKSRTSLQNIPDSLYSGAFQVFSDLTISFESGGCLRTSKLVCGVASPVLKEVIQNEDLVIIPGVEKKTFLLFIELITKGELTNLSLKDLNAVNELASFLGVNNIKVHLNLKGGNSLEQPSIKEPQESSGMPTAQMTVLTTDRQIEFNSSIPDHQENLSGSDKTSTPCSPVCGPLQGNGDGSETIRQRLTTLDDSKENDMSENTKTNRDEAVLNVYQKEPLNERIVETLSKAHEQSTQTTSAIPESNVLNENLKTPTIRIIPDYVGGNVFEHCSLTESPLEENIDGPGNIQNVSAPDDTEGNVLTPETTQPVLYSIQNSESVALETAPPRPIPQLNKNKFDVSNNIPDNFSLTASSFKVSSEINSPIPPLSIKEEVIDLTLDDSEEPGSRWKGNKPTHQEHPRTNEARELVKTEDIKEPKTHLQPNKKANLQKDFKRCSVILEQIRDIKRKREAKKNKQETTTKRSERLKDKRIDKEIKSRLINEMLKKCMKKKKKSTNNSLSDLPPEKQPEVSSSTDCLIEYESIQTGRKRKRDSSEESDFFWLRPSSESSLSEDESKRLTADRGGAERLL